MDTCAVGVWLVFARDVDGFDEAVAVESCGEQRHVIVVKDAYPIF